MNWLRAHRRQEADLAGLFEEHATPVWRFLVRQVGDPHVAEDLLQETMARAVRDPRSATREHEHQRAWMMVVARNLVTDRARSAVYRREQVTDRPADEAHEVSTAVRSHDVAVLDRWLVADALRSLSQAHRQVIVRAYYQDWSVAQIAEELDLAPGTVKSRMHHGMKALRVALQERGVSAR
ncbi:sigma-70 family RNA polymerase sigma factor [Demetria terragena]|uniref:sigma-70 family RNA polymerase sigma factor n=1 Tax=Demetria terragena TaxID=63959 RepID=UPI00037A2470|nr:sigma-70 family RNA polymerase sigma factor [Demetria terragena]